MGFHETLFPTDISYGTKAGPGFKTSIVTVDSGAEERTAQWSQARRRYDVAESIKSTTDLSALITFYMARLGCANGFRFKDWADYATSANHVLYADDSNPITHTDCVIGTGDGTTTTFQLRKQYIEGPTTHVRTITKPVAGTVLIGLNGVNTLSGWTVNTSTGVVTFTTAPAAGVAITAGFQFDVPVRFGDELDQQLPVSLDDYNSGSVSIPLIEISDNVEHSDDFFMGGAVEFLLTANYSLDPLHRVFVFKSTTAGLSVFLPNEVPAAGLSAGGPWYYIINDSTSTQSFTLKTYGGTTLATLTPGQGVEVVLSIDALGTRVWYAK